MIRFRLKLIYPSINGKDPVMKSLIQTPWMFCFSRSEILLSHSKAYVLARSGNIVLLEFRENYMFDCKCARCEEECDQPSATSSEEDSDSEMST